MGTRSIIVINNEKTALRLYKHYDGHPSHTLKAIADGIREAQLKEDTYTIGESIMHEYWVDNGSKSTRMHKEVEAIGPQRVEACLSSPQWDLEYIYLVDLKNKEISLYGGGFFNKPAIDIVFQGNICPIESEISRVRAEYQSDTRKRLVSATTALSQLGFTIEKPAIAATQIVNHKDIVG